MSAQTPDETNTIRVAGPIRGTRLTVWRTRSHEIAFQLFPKVGSATIVFAVGERARIDGLDLWIGGASISLRNDADARAIATAFGIPIAPPQESM